MSDGSERLGHGAPNGCIRLMGTRRDIPQFSLDLVRPTHWQPFDERTFEEFERG